MFDTVDLRTCHHRRMNESERESITRRNTTVARAADFIDLNCKWLPIDCAPRDGTSIIILCQDMEIEAYYIPLEVKIDHEGVDESVGACWCAFDALTQFEVEQVNFVDGNVAYYDGSVTHWKHKTALPSRVTLS